MVLTFVAGVVVGAAVLDWRWRRWNRRRRIKIDTSGDSYVEVEAKGGAKKTYTL